ncbi:hypothetical protein PhCBS80983_g00520 [Powellomyces hirtus]|uniref:Ubiquitin-like modifier-activating enzyme ATG7 n=1 Tax=Powellomyces hirtus TaxID=109895 RepID=A0A507EEV2_9FUNG|nr:hypothetical protein PhCBS80983_g00520 [Powellomyces hirtus]
MSTPDHHPILQFDPLSSAVDPTFWHALSRNKIEVYRLDDAARAITGYYAPYHAASGHQQRGAVSQLVVGAARLAVTAQSFDSEDDSNSRKGMNGGGGVVAPGVLYNTNTIEEFKKLDKSAVFAQVADRIWESITSGAAVADPTLLTRFILLTFADLKKYKFWYWFGFPALLPFAPVRVRAVRPVREVWSARQVEALRTGVRGVGPFFLVKVASADDDDTLSVRGLGEWDEVVRHDESGDGGVTVGFVDPSGQPAHPGWPLRNFLILLQTRWKVDAVRVVCYRETLSSTTTTPTSIVLDLTLPTPSTTPTTTPKCVGWEKNSMAKLSPRSADLGPLMDPRQLADTAVDLNLKLMRWRIVPTLQLEKIATTKCLLVGSGTLGCHVARTLLAWGVRHITFIDNGTVSFSNPVRQPLFTFDDCLHGGRPKAQAAADALKRIFPGVHATGINLAIPMPGHYVPSARDATTSAVERLTALVEMHDAVFLLTDSRESRWLPTLLGKSLGKIVINSALGFDTFLVMRHGMRQCASSASSSSHPTPTPSEPATTTTTTTTRTTPPPPALGCYFCNDVVAPADSLSDRTLDQQCTVTRPGLSSLASATAVELLISILNHPLGPNAAPPPPTPTPPHPSDPTPTPLGLVPHQIRGFLTHYTHLLVTGHAYDKCTACSPTVLELYAAHGAAFVLDAIEDPTYLERVTGLKQMQMATEHLDLEWDVEDE